MDDAFPGGVSRAWLEGDPFADVVPVIGDLTEVHSYWNTFHDQHLDHRQHSIGARHAYVFYVTADAYACGAAVVVRQLKRLGSKKEFLILYPAGLVSSQAMAILEHEGATTRTVPDLKLAASVHRYYAHVLVKLRVFQQVDYDRILFLDSDVSVVANLDHLFDVKLAPTQRLAAPLNYYSDTRRFMPWLMVVEPSLDAWASIEAKYLTASWRNMRLNGKNYLFDGDILNLEFMGDASLKLPPQYAVLNSEYCTGNHAYHLLQDNDPSFAPTGAVHYSCWQKPWYHQRSDVEQHTHHHDAYLTNLYLEWYDTAEAIGCYL